MLNLPYLLFIQLRPILYFCILSYNILSYLIRSYSFISFPILTIYISVYLTISHLLHHMHHSVLFYSIQSSLLLSLPQYLFKACQRNSLCPVHGLSNLEPLGPSYRCSLHPPESWSSLPLRSLRSCYKYSLLCKVFSYSDHVTIITQSVRVHNVDDELSLSSS
jgi:hypothetical protein